VLDTKELARLPEEYRERELKAMNDAIRNEHKLSKVPDGLSEEQFRKVLQMRTDGVAEELVQEELGKMQREDMLKARKHMTSDELRRMADRQAALERDRYKHSDVIAQRQREMQDEYEQIKQRVERRVPLLEAWNRRQTELAQEALSVLNNPHAEAAERARAVRKIVHEPFQDLDRFLTSSEMEELSEIRAHPPMETAGTDDARMARLQQLLATATQRRVEAQIDELLEHEDDVFV
jgi:hypothetical protein